MKHSIFDLTGDVTYDDVLINVIILESNPNFKEELKNTIKLVNSYCDEVKVFDHLALVNLLEPMIEIFNIEFDKGTEESLTKALEMCAYFQYLYAFEFYLHLDPFASYQNLYEEIQLLKNKLKK